ncbi:hypothetical protein FKR81_08400 [Lentzea tibetensis]|uniref:Lipoprotein n=1 Tax=Lentzea tibetensis TaxID=2591470 RepID=A0A563EZD7_9PSEU|nr:hypothetical protein [Lentzea tibetensis]TWP53090.1 hypothetical protein FKR81_08400 [Lentzea tibetensis]
MRKIAVVLLSCLALGGCASDWEGQVRLRVDKIENPQEIWLELVGELPDDALEKKYFKSEILSPSEISGGEVAVGDEVVCTAKQHSIGAGQTNTIKTEISGCRKA